MKKNNRVLITGARSGIGLAIAHSFFEHGSSLVLVSRTIMKEDIPFYDSSRITLIQADISNQFGIDQVLQESFVEDRALDVFVHSAGITNRTSFWEMTPETYHEVFATNVTSAFFLMQEIGKRMIEQKSGHIISISSILGLRADSVSVPYGMSKAALISFTEYLAKLCAPYVRVNSIAPGYIETDWHTEKTSDRRDSITKKIPLERFGTAEEIADLAYFLVTKGTYMTGQTLVADGGYLL